MSATTLCTAGECTRATYKDQLCVGHYQRRRRGKSMGPLQPARGGKLGPLAPHERLHSAAISYADATDAIEDEEANDRAWANLLDAADWVALGVPKTPRLHRLGSRLLSELRATMRAAFKDERAPRPP